MKTISRQNRKRAKLRSKQSIKISCFSEVAENDRELHTELYALAEILEAENAKDQIEQLKKVIDEGLILEFSPFNNVIYLVCYFGQDKQLFSAYKCEYFLNHQS